MISLRELNRLQASFAKAEQKIGYWSRKGKRKGRNGSLNKIEKLFCTDGNSVEEIISASFEA